MKNNTLLSFFFFVLFLYTCSPSPYVTIGESGGIIVSLVPLLLGLLVAVKCRISFLTKSFMVLIGVFAIWNLIIYVYLQRPPSPYPFITLVCAYIAYFAFKKDFIDRFLRTSVALAAISFVVWVLCLMAPKIMKLFAVNFGLLSQDVSYSFFVFNIAKEVGEIWPIRNCGFCWEPGRCSCILVISIYFYLVRYGMKVKSSRFMILFLSLLSTASTTGYGMLMVMLGVWIIYNKKINPAYSLLFIALFLVVWNMPFMREKILGLMVDEERAQEAIREMIYVKHHDGNETFYVPQRIEAMYLQILNFQNMPPITGEGRNITNHYINRYYDINIALSEGILGIFVRYGLILGSFCYFCLLRSSTIFSSYNSKIPRLLFFILFVLANFSYYFWESPLFCLMWCWAFFEKHDDKKVVLNYAR